MREILDDIDRWRAAGARVALARVVDVEGSGPRGPARRWPSTSAARSPAASAAAASRARWSTEALAILAGEAEPRHRDVRLQRRRGVRRRPDVRRHDPPVHRAARLVSAPCDLRRSSRDRIRAEQPVALATVIDGPAPAPSCSSRPDEPAARHARRSRPRPGRRPATRWPSWRPARSGVRHYGPQGQTTPEDLVDSPIVRVFVESLRPAAADVDLRRRRLHRRAGQGRQGARLPGHGVRRPRGVRHPAPVPDGRRGRRRLAGAAVRASAAHDARAAATRCASSPTTPSSTCRRCRARWPPRSATSA